jgi:hypothetical protein
MSIPATAFFSIVGGLLYAAWLYVLAVVCIGMGHGWATPMQLSFLGVFAGAALVFRFVQFDNSRQGIDWLMMLAAVGTNAAIFSTAAGEGVSYFYRAGFFGYLWLASWAAWQIPVLLLVVFGKTKPENS